MIFCRSALAVTDNSGVLWVYCLRNVSFPKRAFAKLGDIILVVSKDVVSQLKIKKGQLFRALVINTSYGLQRTRPAMNIKFLINSVVILKKDELVPLATRIFIAVPFELLNSKVMFKRLLSVAFFKI